MTISSWLNFGHPVPPGMGSAAERNFWLPYYSRCAVFVSPPGPPSTFSFLPSLYTNSKLSQYSYHIRLSCNDIKATAKSTNSRERQALQHRPVNTTTNVETAMSCLFWLITVTTVHEHACHRPTGDPVNAFFTSG